MLTSVKGHFQYEIKKKNVSFDISDLNLQKINIIEIMIADRTLAKFPWYNGKYLSHSDLVCKDASKQMYIIKN